MQVKGQNKFTFMLEFAKTFAESCRKITKLQKVYMAYALGKISFEDFTEACRLILEEQSG